jgi:hypothetical protein
LEDKTQNRFEHSYHHRDHIYTPARHDKEQLHGRKAIGKTNANRSAIQVHSEIPTSKQHSSKARSKTPNSDQNQQIKHKTSPPVPFNQRSKSSCMFIRSKKKTFVPILFSFSSIKRCESSIYSCHYSYRK